MFSVSPLPLVFTTDNDVKEPQFPLNNSTTALNEYTGLTKILWVDFTAVNLYHTSSSASPTVPGILSVAFNVVPVTGVDEVALKLIAPAQSSLAGDAAIVVNELTKQPEALPEAFLGITIQ